MSELRYTRYTVLSLLDRYRADPDPDLIGAIEDLDPGDYAAVHRYCCSSDHEDEIEGFERALHNLIVTMNENDDGSE